MKTFFRECAFLFVIAAPLMAQQAPWSYQPGKQGPDRWANQDKAYSACALGKFQAPTDIHKPRHAKLPGLEFHYMSVEPEVVNNGHYIQVNIPAGSYFLVGGHRYNLTELRFHTPSEQAVEGRLADMEVQLIHQDEQGKLAVLSVLLNETQRANTALGSLVQNLPRKAGEKVTPQDPINPRALLPASLAYWTYPGSLSAPPCTEGADWYVFRQPVEISREQRLAFATIYPRNARPLQPAHDRKIFASE